MTIAACLLLLTPGPLQATPAAPEPADGTLLERIRLFDESVDPVNRLSGVLLIVRGEKELVHAAFGFADQEFRVPNERDTRFCIASITKMMTALVLWQLASEGKLAYDDTLAKLVPEFPRGAEITLTHLLNHRSGIPARVTAMSETWRPLSAAQVTERAGAQPLMFTPGERSVYSSAGYTVLAHVTERVEGLPFREVLRRRVFEPAGMKDSLDPGGRELVARRARPYVPGREELLNAPLQDLSFLAGAGSVVSTAADLLRFLRAYQGDTFHPEAWRSTLGSPDAHWTGASNGFHSFVDHDARSGTTVIFLGNSFGRAAGELRTALPRILAGEDVLAAPRPAVIALPRERLLGYVGRYQTRPGAFCQVEVLGDELMLFDVVALPVSATEFWYQPWNAILRFTRASESEPWSLQQEGQPAWPRVGDPE